VRRALPHIGPAVLGSLVVPALVLPGGSLSWQATVPTLVAAAACGLVWWRSRSTPLGLVTAWAAGAVLA
jgi:branched-subunit amino acid transport protein